MENLPQDAAMLLSFVNTKLRDEYASLDDLCADLNTDRADLEGRLRAIGYEYDADKNKFI